MSAKSLEKEARLRLALEETGKGGGKLVAIGPRDKHFKKVQESKYILVSNYKKIYKI